MDALEEKVPNCNIWNYGDFLDPSYHGKIDIECEDRRYKDKFYEIISKVEKEIQEKQDSLESALRQKHEKKGCRTLPKVVWTKEISMNIEILANFLVKEKTGDGMTDDELSQAIEFYKLLEFYLKTTEDCNSLLFKVRCHLETLNGFVSARKRE